MKKNTEELLKEHKLSITDARKRILALFLKNDSALAHGDIEENVNNLDRVTIYRTLQIFLEKGIIHTIPTTDNSTKYALCKNECTEGHHHDEHVHFICTECGTTSCLDEVNLPVIKLPKGYKVKQTEIVVNGICKSCN